MHAQRTRSKLVVFISYATMLMLGIYISLYQYTILSISQIFLVNSAVMGLMVGAQHLGMSAPPLFLGALCGKIGKKKLLVLSYALIILGTLLVGALQSFGVFIISVFIIGAGFSVTEATTSAVLTDEYPEEITKHINFSQMTMSVGALAGPLIAEKLIGSGVYFKNLYYYCSAAFLIILIVFLFSRHHNDKGTVSAESGNFNLIRFLGKKIFLLLALGIFLYVGIENTTANFTDSYFKLDLGAPELSATALSLFWGAMIPSRFLAGILKIDHKKMFIVLTLLVFLATITAMLVPDHTVKIIMFALCGFGCGPLWPLIVDTVAKKNKGASGPALNVMLAFSGLGGAAFPFLSGALVNFAGQSAAFYACAAASVFMLAVYLASAKMKSV